MVNSSSSAYPVRRFAVGLHDGCDGFVIGLLGGIAQGTLAGYIAQVASPAEMKSHAAGKSAQGGQSLRIAAAVVTHVAIGHFPRHRVVGEQHGFAGLLVPVSEVRGHGLGTFEMLKAQDIHIGSRSFDDIGGDGPCRLRSGRPG